MRSKAPVIGFLLAVMACATLSVEACTTAVISAKASADGRPLLWKNRDADDLHNQVVYCADGKYAYLGIVNRGDVAGFDIWAGLNERGFAIMNAASYNLKGGEDTKGEGAFMKLALQTCATVEDFQALLEKTAQSKRDVSANFGVIDGAGGAAYFETAPESYKRFDAAQAPGGWLVRSNFSESGDPKEGAGITRCARGRALVGALAGEGRLTARTLFAEACKDTANANIGSYPAQGPRAGGPRFAFTGDSICRYDTSCAFVAAGPRAGEDPRLATLWVIPAQPVTGAAVPLWVAAGSVPQELAAGKEASAMTEACDAVRARFYPETLADMKRYLDIAALADPKSGLLKPLLALEAENFQRADTSLAAWAKKLPAPEEMKKLQEQLARETAEKLKALAGK